MAEFGPNILYKYMRKEHLDSFYKEGALRLGTLFEFRNEEFHGSAVGDSDEGRNTRVLTDSGTQSFNLFPLCQDTCRVI